MSLLSDLSSITFPDLIKLSVLVVLTLLTLLTFKYLLADPPAPLTNFDEDETAKQLKSAIAGIGQPKPAAPSPPQPQQQQQQQQLQTNAAPTVSKPPTSALITSEDVVHFDKYMTDDLSPHSLLLLIASCPSNLARAAGGLVLVKKAKEARSKNSSIHLSDEGWSNDAEELTPAVYERRMEEKKHLLMTSKVSGGDGMDITGLKIEGVDEGVLGADWIFNKLEALKVWPGDSYEYQESVRVIADRIEKNVVLKRNMIITMGRINSMLLNNNAELIKATKEQKIDSQFASDMIGYRSCAAGFLDHCLHLALKKKLPRVARTILETLTMWKIGVPSIANPQIVAWFKASTEGQYGKGSSPKLKLKRVAVRCDVENSKNIVVNDGCLLSFEVARDWAQAFTNHRLAILKANPQLTRDQVIDKYCEGWWIVLTIKKFELENGQASDVEELLIISPINVTDVEQTIMGVQVKFKAHKDAGTYTYGLHIVSTDFIGAGLAIDLTVKVEKDRTFLSAAEKAAQQKAFEESKESAVKAKEIDEKRAGLSL